jgi:hypothetical protein
VNGRKADEVAQQFGLTRNQVYLARSRIRHRLKCDLDGLLEDDGAPPRRVTSRF